MRIIRYRTNYQAIHTGWIMDDMVGEIEGSIFGEYRRKEATIPFSKVKLLPPCTPSKIVCVGRNYAEHAKEQNSEISLVPLLFLKPPSALIAHTDEIILPSQSHQVEFEGELAVIIAKQITRFSDPPTKSDIFGYTIANDVTARDLQRSDNQWTRAKGFDTFCPLGPWIDTDFDPSDALITTHLNGVMRQMATTKDMLFSIPQLIAYISSIMTLEPGDLILSGTPAGVGVISNGDGVKVSIDGLGDLYNPVTSV